MTPRVPHASVRGGEPSDRTTDVWRPTSLEHVALFLADLGGGGAERMMVTLASGLAARGVRTDLLLAEAKGPYLTEVSAGVHTIDLERRGVLRALPKLVRYLRRERPQVLFSTLAHTSLVALAAARTAGGATRVFVREANTPSAKVVGLDDPREWLIARSMRIGYRMAAGVVAVSEGVAADLRDRMGVPPSKIAALYNPVVKRDIAAMAAEDPGHPWLVPGGPPVVLSVGRLHPQKDYPTLFQAFARLRADRRVRLVVLGEGPERADLERLSRELGIEDVVALPGFVDNPFAFMARADVFALSSVREGLPGALIQAMACGCPVVATDCPSGPAEILDHGRLGDLVEVGSIAGMAAALARTLDAPVASDDLVARSGRYEADAIIDAHAAYFEAALERA